MTVSIKKKFIKPICFLLGVGKKTILVDAMRREYLVLMQPHEHSDHLSLKNAVVSLQNTS